VDPWPFADDIVRIRYQGRRLDRSFEDQEELDAALAVAPWVTVEVTWKQR
jgi:hypothetical protein